jgi:hypothetical protein
VGIEEDSDKKAQNFVPFCRYDPKPDYFTTL